MVESPDPDTDPDTRSNGRLTRLVHAGVIRRSRTARARAALSGKVPKPRASVVAALLEERLRDR